MSAEEFKKVFAELEVELRADPFFNQLIDLIKGQEKEEFIN